MKSVMAQSKISVLEKLPTRNRESYNGEAVKFSGVAEEWQNVWLSSIFFPISCILRVILDFKKQRKHKWAWSE